MTSAASAATRQSVRPVFAEASSPERGRLASLDVFRGMVIVAMLVVNNIGDPTVVGYFWKHAGWIEVPQSQAYAQWWAAATGSDGWRDALWLSGQFPLLRHVTLADYVMPLFMLIIGVAMPFAVSARKQRGEPAAKTWLAVLRRALTLVVLGWAIGISLSVLAWHHSPDPHARLDFTLGMDVLQLLGLSYLLARVLYTLPLTPRIVVAAMMFLGHWALLRYYPQGDVPAGTFTAQNESIGYIYRTWAVFQPVELVSGRAYLSFVGMLSVVPAAATMVLGTWIGHWLHRADLSPVAKVRELIGGGVTCAIIGFLWAFDLPFNKPRWTPAYLLWCSGVGSILLAVVYWLVDLHGRRGWTRVFIVFGTNSIAVYWLSIMVKIWTINMIKVAAPDGGTMMLTTKIVRSLQSLFDSPALGSWAFTVLFIAFWWTILEVAYRKKIFWKL